MTGLPVSRSHPTIVLGMAAFVAPLLAVYAPLGIAPLLAVTAVALLFGLMADRQAIRPPRLLILIAGSFLLWSAASTAWTLHPKAALLVLAQITGVALGAIVTCASAPRANSRPVVNALLAALVLALAIYAIETLFNAPIQTFLKHRTGDREAIYSAFNRGLAVLVVLTPVAIMAFRKAHPVLCAILAGVTATVVFFYFGSAMQLAAVVAIVAGIAVALAGRWVVRLIGTLALIGMLAAPFVAHRLITPDLVDFVSQRTDTVSAQHRLVIWRFVSERIMEKPLTGWGLDSARAMPGGKDQVQLHVRTCQAPCFRLGEQLPLHPHNLALQLWLELGLVGAALGAVAVFGLFWAIAAWPLSRWDRALLAAQASTGLVISGLSYGAWQTWWLSALALAGALSLCVIGQRNNQDSE